MQQRAAALKASMAPAAVFDFSSEERQDASASAGYPEMDGRSHASCSGPAKRWHGSIPEPIAWSTSDTLPLIPNVDSRFSTDQSMPEWSELEALLRARDQLDKLELSAAVNGESQDRFEFAAPPVFEESFEEHEHEHIDGCSQVEVSWDVYVGDVGFVKPAPADFGLSVETHLQGRLPAPQQSRYHQILGREEQPDVPVRLDGARFASGSAAKALKQFLPRSASSSSQELEPASHQGPRSAHAGAGISAPPAAVPLMPQAPTAKRPAGRGTRPGPRPTMSSSSCDGEGPAA